MILTRWIACRFQRDKSIEALGCQPNFACITASARIGAARRHATRVSAKAFKPQLAVPDHSESIAPQTPAGPVANHGGAEQIVKSLPRELSGQRLGQQPAVKRPAGERTRTVLEDGEVQRAAPSPWPQLRHPGVQRGIILLETFAGQRRPRYHLAPCRLLPRRKYLVANAIPEIGPARVRPVFAPRDAGFAQPRHDLFLLDRQ